MRKPVVTVRAAAWTLHVLAGNVPVEEVPVAHREAVEWVIGDLASAGDQDARVYLLCLETGRVLTRKNMPK